MPPAASKRGLQLLQPLLLLLMLLAACSGHCLRPPA
jgi:hypothetical protein